MFKTIKRPALIILFLLTGIAVSFSQQIDFNNYTPLVSSGTLPEEFATTVSEKYRETLKKEAAKDKKGNKMAKKEFYLKSSFHTDNFLRSGKVLFNDPIGKYLDSLLDIIRLQAGLDTGVIKVFAVKSNYSNAFASDEGYIFVTTGLLARLQNEAQLAFVLCHEMVHFQKKHSIDIFLKNKNSKINLDNARKKDAEIEILGRAAYSRDKETEADMEGLKIFLKTSYKPAEAAAMFDYLPSERMPADTHTFNHKIFETRELHWPDSVYALDTFTTFENNDTAEEEYSTHPNIDKRVKAIEDQLELIDPDEKKSENNDHFFYIRKIARYEYCQMALAEKKYSDAVYVASALKKENTKSIYLDKIIAKSLYAIAKYCSREREEELYFDPENTYGKTQAVYHFFNEAPILELNELALYHWWKLYLKDTNDIEVKGFLEDLTKNIIEYHYYELPEYYSGQMEDSIFPDVFSIKENESAGRVQTVFAEFNSGTAFSDFIGKMALETESSVAEKDEAARKKFRRKYKGLFNNKLHNAQGEKVIFFSPTHYSIDERKKITVRYEAGEKRLGNFIERIKTSADAAKIPYEILSPEKLTQNDARLLNNITTIKNWFEEQAEHDDSVTLLTSDYGALRALSDSLGARYICLVGNLYLIQKKTNLPAAIALSVMVPVVTWPFTLNYLLFKNAHSLYFMVTLDLKTGTVLTSDFRHIRAKSQQDISLAILYDFMLNIKYHQLEKK